jgi:transcription elongation factor GreA
LVHPNLVALARQKQIEELERAWQAELATPEQPDHYVQAIEALCDADLASKALNLAQPMVDALAQADRVAEATRLALSIVRRGAHSDSLCRRLLELYERQFADSDWYSLLKERAGITSDNPSSNAIEEFEKLRSYTVGHVVYHRGGWGEGIVEEFRAPSQEVVIRFASGRRHEVPFSTVLESMTPLPAEDLRSMRLTAPKELERLVEEDPGHLIRKAARVYRGRITSLELKDMLCPSVVPAKRWNDFWKRARAAAAIDPYLQVEGTAARPIFVVRKKPLSFEEEARMMMRRADHLGGEIAVLRSYLERSPDPATTEMILRIAHERVASALQPGVGEAHEHLLEALLLLEEHGRSGPKPAAEEVRALLIGPEGAFHPEQVDKLPTQDAREHAIQLLPQALGSDWADRCIEAMTRIPASVVEQVVDLLREGGHGPRLVSIWSDVAPFPRRHPVLTFLLGRLHNEGVLDGQPGAPDHVTVARVLLHLVRTLTEDRRDPIRARLRQRVVSLMTNRRSFFSKLLETIDRESLAAFVGIAERGGEEFPQEVSDQILKAVANLYPDLTEKPERPFWEQDLIFTTRDGLERQRAEYRRLVEEKIPQNSKAIGAAAAQGDLSENSEWESAMEEQRNLTARAGMMDQDLKRARLIEEQTLPDDVVAPGTLVAVASLQGQARRSIRVLGPWDLTADDVINYRAPIAKTLLGRRSGDEVELPGQTGTEAWRIERIEKLFHA